MKRYISIFTFLLGTFAAVGPFASFDARASAHVYGYGVYSPDGSLIRDTDANYRITPHDRSIILRDITDAGGAYPVTVTDDTPGWAVDHWVYQNVPDILYRKENEKDVPESSGKSAVYITDASSDYAVSYAVYFRYIQYNLAYDSAGGTPTPTGGTYTYDTQVQLAVAPSRPGYTFSGWRASSVGETFAASETVSGTNLCPATWHEDGSNVTMTAQWTANTYTVTFDGNGGGTPSPTSKTATYDSEYGDLATCERQGWRFDGWWTEADRGTKIEPTTKVTIVSNHTVYAHWTQKFTVTFYEDEKFNDTTPQKDGVIKVEYVLSGGSATRPADPTHVGYRFTGWSGTYTGVTRDENVYATYQGKSYRIIMHANDGSGQVSEDPRVYGEEAKELLPMTRPGYTLKGWAESPDAFEPKYQPGEKVSNLATEGEVHLYALWAPISYKVTFDRNGGEGEMDPVSLAYGTPFTVPECDFTKQGCAFRSWSATVGGVATNFVAGEVVSNLTSEADATVIFRAEWTGYYTVAFDANGGEGTMTNVTFEQNVECQLPSNAFVKTGYRFFAWDDVQNGKRYEDGAQVRNLAQAGETNTLKAVWSTNTYTVVFLPGGAKGAMEDQEFVYDQPQALRNCTFDRGDHALWSFVGWTNSAAGGPLYTNRETVVNLTAESGGRVELTAVWNSTLSPLSLALGCDNLNWTNETTASVWEAGTVDFYGTDIPCVYASGSLMAAMWSSAFTTNGVLHFWWKATGNRLSVQCNGNPGDKWPKDWNWRLADTGFSSDEWHETNLVIRLDAEGVDNGRFYIQHREDSTCWIAKMTWTPEGAEHPEPTDTDKVTISSAAVSDGKFTLSFKSDARFDYNLLTNANLLINSWGKMGETKEGTGETITFEPQIIEGQPQMFYRVDTIQKE